VELQGRLEDLRKQGLGLAAISYDPPEILAAFSRQRGIAFPLLADPGSATITRYGILNTLADEALGPNANDPVLAADVLKYVSGVGVSPRMRGIAFPGTFILDRSGRVKARFFEESYIERNTVSSVMMRVGANGPAVAGTVVSTEHLDIKSYPTEAAIAPGNRFAINFEVTPKPRIHLYAPGASGYRVIGVSIAAQPFVRILPLKYPPSQIYFFRPLNERVPVYEKPFTLMQEVTVEGHPQAQAAFRGKESLTIGGSLDYQACNDAICFNPTSVPLSWTISLRPMVMERPVRPQPQ
jgi:peroxiredoxin